MSSDIKERTINSVPTVRVLLADDNPAMLETLVEMLRQEYVITATVSCGASAVTEALEAEPDIVILDISLGDMTGFEVARRMKKAGSSAKIIFLSVHENSAFVRAGFDVGALGYVFKSRISIDLPEALEVVSRGEHFAPAGTMLL